MATTLEKAHKDPESIKARILAVARRIFGKNGYHGTTTRMIADEAGINISRFHYHWSSKQDLYEAVINDIDHDVALKLVDLERRIHGLPLEKRMKISIEDFTDYLFNFPEISIFFFRNFDKTRVALDLQVPLFIANIVRSMRLTKYGNNTSPRAMMEVWVIINAICSFVSRENLFRPMVGLTREEYIATVKETLKFVLIPCLVERERKQKKMIS
jgi:TetR/AcrR family transcriptional regulator, regulator of cefoperazone and chloramphenicol sensitivity